jgi:hypothetical protein
MTAYVTLLRKLARGMHLLEEPGARTPSVAAAEVAELLRQIDAKEFPSEELGRQCRLLCVELDEFARSSRRKRNKLAVFLYAVRQLLAKCLAEVHIKSDVVSALCPSCKASGKTDVLATWVRRGREDFRDPYHFWEMDVYRILKCRCEVIFSQHQCIEYDDETKFIEHYVPSAFIELELDLDWEVTNYEWIPVRAAKRSPKVPTRQRPAWRARIKDAPLRSLLSEVYAAADSDHRVLTAIGIRTVVDRGMQLLGAGSATGFAQRLNALVGEGLLSSEERDRLHKLTEAGSAAAHRGWRPSREEIDALLDAMEHFLQRFDLKTRTVRIDPPARQRPQTSSIETAAARKSDGVPKDSDAKVVDLSSAKRVVTDESK